MQLQNMTHFNNLTYSSFKQKVTIVMPIRIDSEERKENLRTVLSHINRLNCRVLLLEADSEPQLDKEEWIRETDYQFVRDTSPIFHRTRYINMLLREAPTDIISVWDADILVAYEQVFETVSLIEQGYTIAYPYNGEYVMLSDYDSKMIRKNFDIEYLRSRRMESVFGRRFCGGIFFVNRERYFECGGENENFTGWGPEDAERLRRVSILGHDVCWTKTGQAYHLYHPRGKNSDFHEEEVAIRLRKELTHVCSMDAEELKKYITSWKK